MVGWWAGRGFCCGSGRCGSRSRWCALALSGAKQGVVRMSESFRRLGSLETILDRAEVGPEKDTTNKQQGGEKGKRQKRR